MVHDSNPDMTPAELPRGAFVLSFDLELAWGTFDHGGHERNGRSFDRVRPIVTQLLEMLGRHRIPATFAVVGHLFLDRCARENGAAHPEIVRAAHAWFPHDWFSLDPCSDLERAPHWYGRDLVEQIAADAQGHEIASHSFSHVIFGDSGCSAEAARSELARCAALAREVIGRELRSFVFPRNAVGHLDALTAHGIRVYRGVDGWWFKRLPLRVLARAGHFADDVLALRPPVHLPEWVEPPGIWNVPGSMLYQSRDGLRRLIPIGARVRKAKKGIDAAVARRRIFHLWFHPFNLATDESALLAGFEQVLAYAAGRRDAGALDILTMGALGDRCDTAHTTVEAGKRS